MQISDEQYQLALAVRAKHAGNSEPAKLAAMVIEQYRPATRATGAKHERLYRLFRLMDEDGYPRMAVYATLAEMFSLEIDSVRRTITRYEQKQESPPVFHKIDRTEAA